jgi:hypothetical protein
MTRLVLPLALLLAGCGACEHLAGPEVEISGALNRLGENRASFPVPCGGEIELRSARFDRVLVKPEGDAYTAVATVDAEGVWAGKTRIGYLGRERIPHVFADGHWRPAGAPLPELQEIADLLCRRSQALEKGDAAALAGLVAQGWRDPSVSRAVLLEGLNGLAAAPRGEILAWIVRNERDGAEVLEERRDPASGQTVRLRSQLVREGAQLRFASGLR